MGSCHPDFMAIFLSLQDEIEKAFMGHSLVVKKSLACFLCKGHLLIEDEPGVGKTLLAQALAKSLGLAFKRVQMTPDLLPADLTGSLLWIPNPGEFRFRPGPLFSNLVLLDELNRASAKTQSSVLQAMEERHITVDGTDHRLPDLFFVIATQNPFDSAGVNTLPDSQLDRFALKIRMGRPSTASEKAILQSADREEKLARVNAPLSLEQLLEAQMQVRKVVVSEAVLNHLLKLASKLREDRQSLLSTRAVQSLLHLAQAWAYLEGRDFVLPDDLSALAVEAWGHRARIGVAGTAAQHIEELLRGTSVF